MPITSPGLEVLHTDPRGNVGVLPARVERIAQRIQEVVDPNLWIFWRQDQKVYWVMYAHSVDHQEPVLAVDEENMDERLIERLWNADTQRHDVRGNMERHNEKVQDGFHKQALETDKEIFAIMRHYLHKQGYSDAELTAIARKYLEERGIIQ